MNLGAFDDMGNVMVDTRPPVEAFDAPLVLPQQQASVSAPNSAPVPVLSDNIPVALYGALALDLVMHPKELDQIRVTYGLTETGLLALMGQRGFIDAFRDAKAQVVEHGATAGFKIRARFIAESLMDDMYKLAKADSTDAPLRVKVFDRMASYAGLDPASTKQKGDIGGGGVSVQFNFAPGINGLAHVMPTVVQG